MATISPVSNQPLHVAATGPTNTLVAGVAGYSIVVHALSLSFETADDPALKAGSSTIASWRNLTYLNLDDLKCGDRFVLPVGEALGLDLPGGADCNGVLWYSLRRAG